MIFKQAAGRASFGSADKMGKTDLAHEPHTHCDRDKLYVILQGHGELTIGEETSMVEPGDVAFAAADVVHSLNNPGPDRLIVLVAMGPPPRVKAS